MVQTNSMTSNHIGVVVIIISSSIISIIIIIPNRCRVRKMWNSSSPQRTCTWCKLDLECLCSVWALFLPWTSGVHHQNSSLAQLWLGLGHMGWSKSVPIAKKNAISSTTTSNMRSVLSPAGSRFSHGASDSSNKKWRSTGANVDVYQSMDWFKGKYTGLSPIFHGKIYGFRLRFSLKPIHWTNQKWKHISG